VLTLIGISHHDTPVAVREQLAVKVEELPDTLRRLSARVGPCVILNTCSRLELYVTADVRREWLVQSFARNAGFDAALAERNFSLVRDEDAVRHLLRVAAGIDSMIVGEPEILGQVRNGYRAATDAGTSDALLNRLFHSALRAGRRARSVTGIGQRSLSIASLAASEAMTLSTRGHEAAVLVIGAGEAGRCSAESLIDGGVRNLTVANRTVERARAVAARLGARATSFASLGDELARSDVLIAASSSAQPILQLEDVAPAVESRNGRPLVIMDLAVPRDVEPGVSELPNVVYRDLDDLQEISARNGAARRAELPRAQEVIEEEVGRFLEWVELRDIVPTISALTLRAERTRREQLAKTLRALKTTDDVEERLDALTRALVKQILHDPISVLRQRDAQQESLRAARSLFRLPDPQPPAELGVGGRSTAAD
jgi:glutamyl-tRNA reductase